MRTGPFPDFATGHHPAALALRAYSAGSYQTDRK